MPTFWRSCEVLTLLMCDVGAPVRIEVAKSALPATIPSRISGMQSCGKMFDGVMWTMSRLIWQICLVGLPWSMAELFAPIINENMLRWSIPIGRFAFIAGTHLAEMVLPQLPNFGVCLKKALLESSEEQDAASAARTILSQTVAFRSQAICGWGVLGWFPQILRSTNEDAIVELSEALLAIVSWGATAVVGMLDQQDLFSSIIYACCSTSCPTTRANLLDVLARALNNTVIEVDYFFSIGVIDAVVASLDLNEEPSVLDRAFSILTTCGGINIFEGTFSLFKDFIDCNYPSLKEKCTELHLHHPSSSVREEAALYVVGP